MSPAWNCNSCSIQCNYYFLHNSEIVRLMRTFGIFGSTIGIHWSFNRCAPFGGTILWYHPWIHTIRRHGKIYPTIDTIFKCSYKVFLCVYWRFEELKIRKDNIRFIHLIYKYRFRLYASHKNIGVGSTQHNKWMVTIVLWKINVRSIQIYICRPTVQLSAHIRQTLRFFYF